MKVTFVKNMAFETNLNMNLQAAVTPTNGEEPRLGPPLISGGPNLRPLEVLLFYGRSARTATA